MYASSLWHSWVYGLHSSSFSCRWVQMVVLKVDAAPALSSSILAPRCRGLKSWTMLPSLNEGSPVPNLVQPRTIYWMEAEMKILTELMCWVTTFHVLVLVPFSLPSGSLWLPRHSLYSLLMTGWWQAGSGANWWSEVPVAPLRVEIRRFSILSPSSKSDSKFTEIWASYSEAAFVTKIMCKGLSGEALLPIMVNCNEELHGHRYIHRITHLDFTWDCLIEDKRSRTIISCVIFLQIRKMLMVLRTHTGV